VAVLGIFSLAHILFLILGLLWVGDEGLPASAVIRRELAPHANRYEILDGLRGFLALTVFLTPLRTNISTSARVRNPTRAVYSQMGQEEVICFVMTPVIIMVQGITPIVAQPLHSARSQPLAAAAHPLWTCPDASSSALVLFAPGRTWLSRLRPTVAGWRQRRRCRILPPAGLLKGVGNRLDQRRRCLKITIDGSFNATIQMTARYRELPAAAYVNVPFAALRGPISTTGR